MGPDSGPRLVEYRLWPLLTGFCPSGTVAIYRHRQFYPIEECDPDDVEHGTRLCVDEKMGRKERDEKN